jgi:hypothetical protein
MVIKRSFKSSACVLITLASYTLISQTPAWSPSIIAFAIYTLLGWRRAGDGDYFQAPNWNLGARDAARSMLVVIQMEVRSGMGFDLNSIQFPSGPETFCESG